jgi:hypothetical protein
MSLLKQLKGAAGNVERIDAIITGIKPASRMQKNKTTGAMEVRNALAADTVVTFVVEGVTYMRFVYGREVFPKGYPLVGSKGIAGTITLKENKDKTQPPNVIAVDFDVDTISERQFTLVTMAKPLEMIDELV